MKDEDLGEPIRRFLLAIADDEFVMGHRLTDWVARAATLEEDNTIAAISQDELGHARIWYDALVERELVSGDVDTIGLTRGPSDRRNSVLVESTHKDHADMVAIGFLYHEAEQLLVNAIYEGNSSLADRAEPVLQEEPLHRDHAQRWIDRLTATDEARERMNRALTDALVRARDLFAFREETVGPLVEAGVLAKHPEQLAETWASDVRDRLAALPYEPDEETVGSLLSSPALNGRNGEHTDGLIEVIDAIHSGDLVGEHPVS